MRYGSIKLEDCANGPGLRTCLFVSGCTHHCPGCFNPQTWSFDYGQPYTPETERIILKSIQADYIDGLSILGGEPMDPANQPSLCSLVSCAHWMGKTVWIYTGYLWEELIEPDRFACGCTRLILDMADVVVDGPFIEAEKDISLLFRGSRNQRLIDVRKSLEEGKAVLWAMKK